MKGSAIRGKYERDAVMTRSATTILAAVWGALQVFAGSTARAAAPSCASIVVDAEAEALDRWPDMPGRIRAAFAGRRDIDTCARVHLGRAGGSIDLQVSLPDGRSTSRLARPEDVVAGLEGLLLVPKEAAPTTPATSPASATSTRFEPAVVEVRRDGRGADVVAKPRTTPPGAPPSRFAAELSLGASVHTGDGQTSTSVGVTSFLEAASWLVGFAARLDRYGSGARGESGDAPAALEVGALLGRRFRFGRLMFDATAGPALALRGDWSVVTATSASAGMANTVRSASSHNDFVPRLLVGGRLSVGARSIVRTFVGIEGEVGEPGPVPPGAARGLPLWSIGAALGVTVGTL
jgi:hypothetical protein